MKPLLLALTAIVIGTPGVASALLDFVAKPASEAAKAAVYAEAAAELATELGESSAIAEGAANLARRTERLSGAANNVRGLGSDIRDLASGNHDWSARRLDENIRFTTRFVKRAKRLLVQLGVVGTDGATAMNTSEMTNALLEVQRNQQTQILLEKERRVEEAEREVEKQKAWERFIRAERERRGSR